MIGENEKDPFKPTLDRMICQCGWTGFYWDLENENVQICPMCHSKDIKNEDIDQQKNKT